MEQYDIAVVGAGMAGASVAAELAASMRVALLEREFQPGYHTTGRSAALFAETYGPEPVRALTRASAAFYERPPPGFAEHPLLGPRGALMIARADQLPSLQTLIDEVAGHSHIERLGADEMRERVPILRPGYAVSGFLDQRSRDIDVHALLQGYLRLLGARAGTLLARAELQGLERVGERWELHTSAGKVAAAMVVNAAGAWADEVGAMSGAMPIGLVPKRRTAMIVGSPAGVDPARWPAVVDVDELFYLKTDAGRLLISPADETPSVPCDAQPEEIDVAVCVERIQSAFDLPIARIETRWAGLRSFVADKCPVAGFDPQAPGFFWLAGQGGYGIQMAPALARAAAALLRGERLPADLLDQGLSPGLLAPERLGAPARFRPAPQG